MREGSGNRSIRRYFWHTDRLIHIVHRYWRDYWDKVSHVFLLSTGPAATEPAIQVYGCWILRQDQGGVQLPASTIPFVSIGGHVFFADNDIALRLKKKKYFRFDSGLPQNWQTRKIQSRKTIWEESVKFCKIFWKIKFLTLKKINMLVTQFWNTNMTIKCKQCQQY